MLNSHSYKNWFKNRKVCFLPQHFWRWQNWSQSKIVQTLCAWICPVETCICISPKMYFSKCISIKNSWDSLCVNMSSWDSLKVNRLVDTGWDSFWMNRHPVETLWLCVYTYICVYIHTFVYTYICVYIHLCIHIHTWVETTRKETNTDIVKCHQLTL